ncbi:unnamed protein product [Thlaspi arvense]|uniref:CRAL-TRIO domain-containing protein n=1 Tax=Thlaspi arvense TaxID=13288 RepID=A0AAU9SS59_THLAR|nr:unnamed protein product [Thlaspi arvense]
MSQDSATTTSPPPPSTAVDSMPNPSTFLTQQDQPPKLDIKDGEGDPKLIQLPAVTVTPQPQATIESELPELIQPPPVTLEPNQGTLEPERTQPEKLELIQPQPESPELSSEHNLPLPLFSEPECFNNTAEDSKQPHKMTPETNPNPLLLVLSEAEEPNHAAEDETKKSRQMTPETVTSEPNQTEEDDSVKPNTETEQPETEPAQKLMLEQRKKYTEVADWTEPEPPDAAVLEAAASMPEPPKQPESLNPEVAQPPASAFSPVESRSLAEMMNREEAEEKPKIHQIPRNLGSFKEETNKVSDLSEPELNALHELQHLLQESTTIDSGKSSIWGVPLLNDVVLLKFLRARDFKPQEAYSMLNKTLQWRNDFNIEEFLDENLGDDLDKVVFMQGHDRENHPVCYNVYGEFRNKDLYQKTFSDEEKRELFLRWRIQFLEKSIRKLDFVPGGVSTICQVNDLKNSPGPGKTELRLATKQALHLLQDNYPEFVSKQIFINVPWWYLAFYRIISPFMTQRSKSKLVFSSPSRSAETLFKYISPEHVPVQYGGLSVDNCDCSSDFTHDDTATEITVKPTTKQTVEIIIYENKEGYTIIIQKPRKMVAKDEPVVSQSFNVGEVGKILLTVDNPTSTKKILIYRFKVMPLPYLHFALIYIIICEVRNAPQNLLKGVTCKRVKLFRFHRFVLVIELQVLYLLVVVSSSAYSDDYLAFPSTKKPG